jgi:hypothetical protein
MGGCIAAVMMIHPQMPELHAVWRNNDNMLELCGFLWTVTAARLTMAEHTELLAADRCDCRKTPVTAVRRSHRTHSVQP